MGVMWTVWPLDAEMVTWLEEQAIVFEASASRWPTGAEIKRALSELALKIEVTDNGPRGPWDAFVEKPNSAEGEWAHLVIQEYSGDDEQQKLHFSKGHESLIRRILSQIALTSGPLVLLNDVGSPPEVITKGV